MKDKYTFTRKKIANASGPVNGKEETGNYLDEWYNHGGTDEDDTITYTTLFGNTYSLTKTYDSTTTRFEMNGWGFDDVDVPYTPTSDDLKGLLPPIYFGIENTYLLVNEDLDPSKVLDIVTGEPAGTPWPSKTPLPSTPQPSISGPETLRPPDTSTPEPESTPELTPSAGPSRTEIPPEKTTPAAPPTTTTTSTPEPTKTSTPEPTKTSTPEPTETSTPEPTETSTPEPTSGTPGGRSRRYRRSWSTSCYT